MSNLRSLLLLSFASFGSCCHGMHAEYQQNAFNLNDGVVVVIKDGVRNAEKTLSPRPAVASPSPLPAVFPPIGARRAPGSVVVGRSLSELSAVELDRLLRAPPAATPGLLQAIQQREREWALKRLSEDQKWAERQAEEQASKRELAKLGKAMSRRDIVVVSLK